MISRALGARIKRAWSTGFYDTTDLADRFKLPESEIYNLIGRAKLPTSGEKNK
jgi:hypothetical protein